MAGAAGSVPCRPKGLSAKGCSQSSRSGAEGTGRQMTDHARLLVVGRAQPPYPRRSEPEAFRKKLAETGACRVEASHTVTQ